MWDRFDENNDWNDENEDSRHEDPSAHPIKKKANDIVRLTFALVGSLDEAHTKLYGEAMIRDAKEIRARFEEAESEKNYVLKMENAVLLKVHARSLCEMSIQLRGQGSFAKEHEKLLQDAISELKVIYKEWIQGFDRSERTDDGWGIFVD